jgi:hypothetical protein
MRKVTKDFLIERALQVPHATQAIFDYLLEEGMEISVPADSLSHFERVDIIRECLARMEAREALTPTSEAQPKGIFCEGDV